MSPEVVSHYRILQKLGQGGMGEVYLAEDTALDRKVALKFLPPEMEQDPTARKRFMREAKAAAALDHPFVCHIHEVGESAGKPFIAMEYVEGQTLREEISRGPLPLDDALRAALEIAEALQRAHDAGIVHRDLKPSNVMVTPSGHVKVMDFGLAKQVSRAATGGPEATLTGLTAEGATVGTLAYMSPEQICGQSVDARSDLFSLGITLYEMLAGIHPFKRDSGVETARAILNDSPPPLSQYPLNIPETLQRTVDKMLAKVPEERHQSVQEVQAELRQARREQETETMTVPPAGWKGTRVVSRRRVAAFALVCLAAVLGWWIQQHYFKTPASALAFQERDWILITDFENQTGEEIFSGSLETAMTVSVQQSKYVNVFPRARVQATLKRMRKDGVQKLDENLGAEVALREGIKGLLVCSVSKVGNEYLLAARLIDPGTHMAVYSQSSRAGGQDKVLGALDELADRVRHGLGESLANISQQRVPLLQATTSSLEALKSYTDARYLGGDAAMQLLDHAIQLDPDFALARADLGFRYYIANNRATGEEHFKKALGLLDRLTLREQLWIRALVEDWRGNRDQGIENYRAYLQQYPDDSIAWFRLGYALLITDQSEPAARAFSRAIEINPSDSAAHINLATCYNALDRKEEALATYQKAFQLNPEEILGDFVNQEYGYMLARMGRTEEAAETFRKMLTTSVPGKRAKGHRSLGLLAAYRGQYSQARSEFSEAMLINKAAQNKLSEMRDHLFLASVLEKEGRPADFEREMAAARQIQHEIQAAPSFLYNTGKIYARAGKTEEAERILGELKSRLGDTLASSSVDRSNRRDQACYYLLQGEVALARREPRRAVESIQIAAKLDETSAREPLALALLRNGERDEAISRYLDFVNAPPLYDETQALWILAHYELGKLYEQKGDTAKAVEFYRKFTDLWREGDADLAPLADARARLATLTKTNPGD